MEISKENKYFQKIKNKNYEKDKLNYYTRDLTNLKSYSIDENDTIEIDDSISLERICNKYKIWIHIASPAKNIKFDSEIDKKARKLISTIYLCGKNIYMFPEKLIKNKFSLIQNETRNSLSLGVLLNDNGSVLSYEIVESLIKINYRLNYEEADELIDYAPKEEEDLSILSKLLEKRKTWRKTQGAIEILEPIGKIVVKDNKPIIKIIEQTISRLLISEAMILYGDLLSQYTIKNNIPVPYRVQDSNRIQLNKKNNTENEILYNFKLKKSMGKTYYSSNPLRHNSLGLDSYLQASSPIRRYSDLIVHYQISKYINKEVLLSKNKIDDIISYINNQSRQNINRYREDQKYWIFEWFKNSKLKKFQVVFLNWINRYKNISIIYFNEYKFSTICYLETKLEVKEGQIIYINNITIDYQDMLYFQLIFE